MTIITPAKAMVILEFKKVILSAEKNISGFSLKKIFEAILEKASGQTFIKMVLRLSCFIIDGVNIKY